MCSKCQKFKGYVKYKGEKYCNWYCAKKGQFMTKQEILDRIYNIIDNKGFNDVDLDLLRNDLEDDIIWENKMKNIKQGVNNE